MYFEETNLGVFIRNPNYGIKNNFWASEQYKKIAEFCFEIRDGILEIVE